ncbi:germination protein, Ger(X)C family [Halobacteroides halobius DSM 5150]|uniref:Germination protein, Ger(X)C family n=1 Tax=Halobacteroides halobius (strain ATCC 35273 / DSM 5150 / MD-1) TaxID=748449 RepID=L0K688_HALHC|nr:Ger(x)C family spore germination protein [Halobacteroides halobius]AGB40050.1 germination protein, Ger(X)C family [Halobacteroides halobius DSM 5150]
MKRIVKILIIILVLNLLTGCWDRRDLEDRVPILAIGIDFAEDKNNQVAKKNKIKITIQAPIPAKMAEKGGDNVTWVVTATGNTIAEAINEMQTKMNQKLFFGHLRIIVFSQELAKTGIRQHLNFFRNLPEIRRLSWLLVAKKSAEDVIKAKPKLESISAVYLMHMLNNGVNMGQIPNLRLGDFYVKLADPGAQPSAVLVKANKDVIDYIGLGVFEGDELVGTLSESEAIYYQRILGVNDKGSLVISDPTTEIDRLTIKIEGVSTYLRPKFENKELVMHINTEVEGKVIEQLNQSNLSKEKVVRRIEKRIEIKLKKEIKKLIRKTQDKFQADIFGVGEYVRAYYPNYWNSIEWHNKYPKLKIDVETQAYIRQVGMIKYRD